MKGNDNLKKHLKRTEGISSRRIFITALTAAAVLILGAVLVLGVCLKEQALTTDFTRKNIAPCIQYPFGTDWMGRDMFVRTLTGLSLSIRIGLITSVFSSVIAVGLGLACAAGGKWADSLISGLIDVVMGIPHILLLLLISFALGKGLKGVAVDHPDSLDFFNQTDPGGSIAAEGKPFYKDRRENGHEPMADRDQTYDAPSASTGAGGNGAYVPSCHIT